MVRYTANHAKFFPILFHKLPDNPSAGVAMTEKFSSCSSVALSILSLIKEIISYPSFHDSSSSRDAFLLKLLNTPQDR